MADMNRRQQWHKVLDFEVQRWLAMPYEQLQFALRHQQAYEIEFESKKYQVEIEILENTEQYVHVMGWPLMMAVFRHPYYRRSILSFATSQFRVFSGSIQRMALQGSRGAPPHNQTSKVQVGPTRSFESGMVESFQLQEDFLTSRPSFCDL